MTDREQLNFFADRPAVPSLLELIEQYRDLHLIGKPLDAADAMAEISRRLTAAEQFHGTEASRINAILTTGEDKAWWQS
jgi:hypothetical protein